MKHRLEPERKHGLKIGQNCFVRRPDESFSGIVQEINGNRVRVVGKGNIEGTYFNEWFPIQSDKCWVVPAST